MFVTKALVNARVRSDKLYTFIIRYLLSLNHADSSWMTTVAPNVPIFFFYSLAKAYPTLDSEPEFFKIID